jgi:hypothetical protein
MDTVELELFSKSRLYAIINERVWITKDGDKLHISEAPTANTIRKWIHSIKGSRKTPFNKCELKTLALDILIAEKELRKAENRLKAEQEALTPKVKVSHREYGQNHKDRKKAKGLRKRARRLIRNPDSLFLCYTDKPIMETSQ